jgi:hypothetical protein
MRHSTTAHSHRTAHRRSSAQRSSRGRTRRCDLRRDPSEQDYSRTSATPFSSSAFDTGGDVPNATYRNHGTHAEAIEIVFNPEQTSYRELLEFFFQIHDATTLNRQGNDIGTSYRSAIFYLDEQQRRIAEETIADVDASGKPVRLHLPFRSPGLGFGRTDKNGHRLGTSRTLRPFPICRVLGYCDYPFCTPKSPRTTRSMTGSGYAPADRRSRE